MHAWDAYRWDEVPRAGSTYTLKAVMANKATTLHLNGVGQFCGLSGSSSKLISSKPSSSMLLLLRMLPLSAVGGVQACGARITVPSVPYRVDNNSSVS